MSATTIERRAPVKARVITIMKLGEGVGAQDRVSLDASEWAHKAFAKADEEKQRAMRREFVIGYVTGRMHVSNDVAETIVDKKREERTKAQELAVNAAGQKFKYHVARDGAKRKGARAASPKVKTTDLTEADEAQCVRAVHAAGFERVNVKSVEATIAYLQAFKRKLARAA